MTTTSTVTIRCKTETIKKAEKKAKKLGKTRNYWLNKFLEEGANNSK